MSSDGSAYEVGRAEEPGTTSGPEFRSRSASQSRRNKDNWKKAVLVLNAARRFREAGGRVAKAKDESAGSEASKTPRSSQDLREVMDIESGYDFAVSPEELVDLLSLPCEIENLSKFGTPADVARKLNVNPASGVQTKDVQKRVDYFGSNVIPQPPHKKFWAYVWDACQDVTLIILMFCAVASLIAGLAGEWSRAPPSSSAPFPLSCLTTSVPCLISSRGRGGGLVRWRWHHRGHYRGHPDHRRAGLQAGLAVQGA